MAEVSALQEDQGPRVCAVGDSLFEQVRAKPWIRGSFHIRIKTSSPSHHPGVTRPPPARPRRPQPLSLLMAPVMVSDSPQKGLGFFTHPKKPFCPPDLAGASSSPFQHSFKAPVPRFQVTLLLAPCRPFSTSSRPPLRHGPACTRSVRCSDSFV